MLPEITQSILNAKLTKKLTFAELASAVGCNAVFLAAVCYRQASASHEQAVKLLDYLGLDKTPCPELDQFSRQGRADAIRPCRSAAVPLL